MKESTKQKLEAEITAIGNQLLFMDNMSQTIQIQQCAIKFQIIARRLEQILKEDAE